MCRVVSRREPRERANRNQQSARAEKFKSFQTSKRCAPGRHGAPPLAAQAQRSAAQRTTPSRLSHTRSTDRDGDGRTRDPLARRFPCADILARQRNSRRFVGRRAARPALERTSFGGLDRGHERARCRRAPHRLRGERSPTVALGPRSIHERAPVASNPSTDDS